MVVQQDPWRTLKKELMLQVNEQLYKKGTISETMYERAKVLIVNKK